MSHCIDEFLECSSSNISASHKEKPPFTSCHHEYSCFLPGNDFSWSLRSFCRIITSYFEMYICGAAAVHFNCEDAHEDWWKARCDAASAPRQFAFHFHVVWWEKLWGFSARCVCWLLTEEVCVCVKMAPPIVISCGGCNWAESVLLSDFLTVKLMWVILFI